MLGMSSSMRLCGAQCGLLLLLLGACSGSQLQLFQQPHYGNFTLEHALEVAGQLDEELLVYAKEMKQMRAKEGRVATLEKKLNRLSDASRGHGIISMDLEREVNELSLEREGVSKLIDLPCG